MQSEISVLAELERNGQKYEWAGENEVKVLCPFHADSSPSCCINVKERVFKCQTASCEEGGDFVKYLARLLKTSRHTVIADLSTRYVLEDARVISAETVERYHQAIWHAGPLLKQLHDRGITNELIKKYRLGEDKGRITIPIKNEVGLFVNVRRYLPGAPGNEKMRNTRGHGKTRLYPIDQLQYDKILVCGGEMKSIVAADQLNKHGWGAISPTSGESNWEPEFTASFKDKWVVVCHDIDEEGKQSARERATFLKRCADWVGIMYLPLSPDQFPHGDINDYVMSGGELHPLVEEVDEFQVSMRSQVVDMEAFDAELSQAIDAKNAGKRMNILGVVSAMHTAPYVIPSKIKVTCDKSQKECSLCPVYPLTDPEFTIHPESAAILDMVACHKNAQRDASMAAIGVPGTCKAYDFDPLEFFNVEDARVSPQLEITSRAVERTMQPALCVGLGLELNESYQLTGRMYPHPKTQESTLLISAHAPTKDALSSYKPDSLERLKIFQPEEWTEDAIRKSLHQLYSDLEANVTRIFQRRELHLAIDLSYHSPLFIPFDGRDEKGWTEVLILGDSSQGKSETAKHLMRHYDVGEKAVCKNATVAGLLGGLQQFGSRWFVTWGVIPTHDKRHVTLEELKGTSTEVIAKLTDMRSSGFAEIPKIEKRRTHARTRLLALSNPRSEMPLASYNFGIEAVKELIGSLEDVRRFDFCLLVSKDEIDASQLNKLQQERPKVEHRFTSDLCRSLILWVWTRLVDEDHRDVIFDSDAEQLVLAEATKLCDEFTDAIPIIDRGSTRLKIARLAAALAGRTFSCSDDMTKLRVRKCHVQFIAYFLRRVYGSDIFGYKDFTEAIRLTTTVLDPQQIKARINESPFCVDFVKQMLHTAQIELVDIMDWNGWERSPAMQMLSFLVRKHALVRDRRAYRKTPEFIRLLKEMLTTGELTQRPDYIPDEEF